MQRLIQGVREFQTEIFNWQRGLFERLIGGQNPQAMFITCADSRVDPYLFTQTLPGDLFIMRNAGNIVPPASAPSGGEAATIEFAVVDLKIRDIVVCGHSHCEAVASLFRPERFRRLPRMADWLRYAEATRRLVIDKFGNLPPQQLLSRAVEENVLVQLDNLRTYPIVASAVASGELRLHGWVYEFETGNVYAYDASQGRFVAIAER